MRALHHLIAPLTLWTIVLAACAPNGEMPENDASDTELIAATQATVTNETAELELRITNTSGEPIELHFNSGQMYDFIVEHEGREVWRWSGDMMFTQALQTRTVEPDETITFEERWTPEGAPSGDLVLIGELTSSSHPLRQETRFRIR